MDKTGLAFVTIAAGCVLALVVFGAHEKQRSADTVPPAPPSLASEVRAAGFTGSVSEAPSRATNGLEDCVRRGAYYFQQIGSYPRLSDGRDAMIVARERCGRTLTAFP